MRVLHIVDNLAVVSGVSSVVMNYYRHIDRDRVQFDFLCMRQDENSYAEEILDLGGRIYYVASPLRVKSFFPAVAQIRRFFKRHGREYKIVHLHSPTTVLFTLSFAKLNKIPFRICHSHSSMFSVKKLVAFVDFLLCIPLKWFTNVFWACSLVAGKFLYGGKTLRSGRVTVINNAIDCERFRFDPAVREKMRGQIGADGKYCIGHVGQFTPIKNQAFLINLFAAVCRETDDAVLVFAGGGPGFEAARDLAEALAISDRVLFLGPRRDIPLLLQAFDVFTLPSLKEGSPVAALEAQASGLPCLLADTITREADCGLADFLPLSPDVWLEALRKKPSNPDRFSVDLVTPGFDIRAEAKKLAVMYAAMDGS